MDLQARQKSLAEKDSLIRKLTLSLIGVVFVACLLAVKLVTQSEIVINQTPGMPNSSVIERTSMDKGAQRATLIAVTSTITQTNPANAEYQKSFLQSFLAPAAYTKVSQEIDTQASRLTSQRELGSYYFVFKEYEYDPLLNKHFVIGLVHTVNAAKDTAESYVFEYDVHVENYRLVVDSVQSYPGATPHDSEWKRANKK